MSKANEELREIVAEQVHLLHAARKAKATPWVAAKAADRVGAYRDADRIVSLFVVREACLRAEIERERINADVWRKRAQMVESDLWAARDKLVMTELSLANRQARPQATLAPVAPAAVPDPTAESNLAPAVSVPAFPSAPAVSIPPVSLTPLSILPMSMPPIQKEAVKIGLIDDAVNILRSILAADEAGIRPA